jgi:type IV fimbrial biogenesis protein FimT
MVTRASAPGFTIIELMVVIAIMGVLTMAALPSFTQFVKNQRVKSASFDVFSTLVAARSEAITRNATVTVTPSSGTTNWASSGWQVKLGTTVLRTQETVPNITITGPTSISYNGSGRITGTASPTIELTAAGTSIVTRCITIDLSGRPVTKASTCS